MTRALWTGRRGAPLHDWSMTPREAIALQRTLARRVSFRPPARPIRTVAGLDVSVRRGDPTCRAGAILVDVETMETIGESVVEVPVPFPYVPGLLSFREVPPSLSRSGPSAELPDVRTRHNRNADRQSALNRAGDGRWQAGRCPGIPSGSSACRP